MTENRFAATVLRILYNAVTAEAAHARSFVAKSPSMESTP
jgi:hypothetical protein